MANGQDVLGWAFPDQHPQEIVHSLVHVRVAFAPRRAVVVLSFPLLAFRLGRIPSPDSELRQSIEDAELLLADSLFEDRFEPAPPGWRARVSPFGPSGGTGT